MAQFTQLLISGNFASGMTYYADYHASQEDIARLVLDVTVEGRLTVEAILDTGAPWCILDPAIIRQLGLTEVTDYEPGGKLMVRGIPYEGSLLRMGIGLRDEYGENDLEVDATVFVPMLALGETWPHPNLLVWMVSSTAFALPSIRLRTPFTLVRLAEQQLGYD